jgi:hypothetical protein
MSDMAEELDIDISNTTTNNNNFSGGLDLKTTNTNNNTSSETLEIKPLSVTSNQTSNQSLDLKPVKVDSSNRQEVAYDPIRTDALSTLDLKPIALDVCMRTGPASLPATHICSPYQHRIGLTLLGFEVLGLAWSGETQTIVDDRPQRPVVAWGAVTPAPPTFHVGLPAHRPSPGHHRDEGGLSIRPKHAHDRGEGGLRIRLTG